MHVAVKSMDSLSVQIVIIHAFYRRTACIFDNFYLAVFILILQNFTVGLFNAAQITEFIHITYSDFFIRVFAFAFFYSYAVQRFFRVGIFYVCAFRIVQQYLCHSALAVIRISDNIVSTDKLRHLTVGIARLRRVLLALFRALTDARYRLVSVMAIGELTSICEPMRAYHIRARNISVLRFVLARFVVVGKYLAVLCDLALSVELGRTVKTVVCERFYDVAFFVVYGFFNRFTFGIFFTLDVTFLKNHISRRVVMIRHNMRVRFCTFGQTGYDYGCRFFYAPMILVVLVGDCRLLCRSCRQCLRIRRLCCGVIVLVKFCVRIITVCKIRRRESAVSLFEKRTTFSTLYIVLIVRHIIVFFSLDNQTVLLLIILVYIPIRVDFIILFIALIISNYRLRRRKRAHYLRHLHNCVRRRLPMLHSAYRRRIGHFF